MRVTIKRLNKPISKKLLQSLGLYSIKNLDLQDNYVNYTKDVCLMFFF